MTYSVHLAVINGWDPDDAVEHLAGYQTLKRDKKMRFWRVARYHEYVTLIAATEDDVEYLVGDECNVVFGHGDGPYLPRLALHGVRDLGQGPGTEVDVTEYFRRLVRPVEDPGGDEARQALRPVIWEILAEGSVERLLEAVDAEVRVWKEATNIPPIVEENKDA